MFFLERTVKQLMMVEWLSGRCSCDDNGFVTHVQIHQNEGVFVWMRFEPFCPEHAIMVTLTQNTQDDFAHVQCSKSHCGPLWDCCTWWVLHEWHSWGTCLSTHGTTPLLLRYSRMHIPSHHYKPLCHCKCLHNHGESKERVCEEGVGVGTHATQKTTVLS